MNLPQSAKAQPQVNPLGDRMRHVLLVDDDEMLLATYEEMLQSNHMLVSTATNGVNALKLIIGQEVDAIVCDWMMPTMAGDMFFLAVQKIKPLLCQRFIFITGHEGHPQFREFLLKNKPVVLCKPVTLGKLLGTLNVAFSRGV
jgi:CheY-like chemotaxis protein